jgi:hypothetical protein
VLLPPARGTARPSTLHNWVVLRCSIADLDSEGLAMSDAFTESMKLCNNVFNSERVSVLASTVAKTEDSILSRIFCRLSMAFSLAVALPKKPCWWCIIVPMVMGCLQTLTMPLENISFKYVKQQSTIKTTILATRKQLEAQQRSPHNCRHL